MIVPMFWSCDSVDVISMVEGSPLISSKFNIAIESEPERLLVCNLRNLNIAWIDKKYLENIWTSGDLVTSEEIRQLCAHGFIISEKVDESSEIRSQRRSFIENRNPKHMQYVIAPTMRCNCNCWYCFENRQDAHVMTPDECDAVAAYIESQVSRNAWCKVLHLTWFGGEPTLALEQITRIGEKLKKYCSSMNIKLESAIVSNGILLTQKCVKRLVESTNLIRCQISMDGTRERYGEDKGVSSHVYDKVLDNLCDIAELIDVTVRVNVHKDNEPATRELYFKLLTLGIMDKGVKVYFAPITNCSTCDTTAMYSTNEFRKLSDKIIDALPRALVQGRYPELRKVSCGAMRRAFACIGPDLKLYRCEHCLGHSEFAIGDVTSGYNPANAFDRTFLGELPERCSECVYVPVCQGGCRVKHVLSIESPDCSEMGNTVKWQVKNLLCAARRGG